MTTTHHPPSTEILDSLILLILDHPLGVSKFEVAKEKRQRDAMQVLPVFQSQLSQQITPVSVIRDRIETNGSSLDEKFSDKPFYISQLREWYLENFDLSLADVNVVGVKKRYPRWWDSLNNAALRAKNLQKLEGHRGCYKLI